MYCKKINANCIDNYDEDVKQIQQLENEIRLLEQHVLNVENRVRQKAAKLAEYELHIKGFKEDQKFDENFWRELHLDEKESCLHESVERNSTDNGVDGNNAQVCALNSDKKIKPVSSDQIIDYFLQRLRQQPQ
ncbi:hypothetical protein COOONC_27518 [Cooperia oncophora]